MQHTARVIIYIGLIAAHLSMTLGFIETEQVAYYEGCKWWGVFTFSIFHKNTFHLAANVLSLHSLLTHWRFKVVHIIGVCICTVLAAFVSSQVTPTLGSSGLILAMCGLVSSWRPLSKASLASFLFMVCLCVIPGINGFIHLVAWTLGFLFGKIRLCILKYLHDSKGYHIGER